MRYKRFENIYIDTKEISQDLLNIEDKVKNNIFSWNGQFSPQLVDELLIKYSKKGDHVFDPFIGSGTTAIECALLGLDVSGVELNPAAYHFSKMYKMCNLQLNERNKLILEFEQSYLNNDNWLELLKNNLLDEWKKSLLIVLILINRGINGDLNAIKKKWNKLRDIVLKLPYSTHQINIYNGDIRKVILPSNYYDLTITSPPYINVYNYHQQYRKEMELIGYDILGTAVSEIGSNRKNRKNRFYTVIQYCIDLAITIQKLLISSKDNARMVFVIGRKSSVLGIDFCNSRLLYEIMVRIFRSPIILRQERYFKNRYGKVIYEDILHFTCNKEYINKDENYITNYARKIACEYLIEKQKDIEKTQDKYLLINDAINTAHLINKSN